MLAHNKMSSVETKVFCARIQNGKKRKAMEFSMTLGENRLPTQHSDLIFQGILFALQGFFVNDLNGIQLARVLFALG